MKAKNTKMRLHDYFDLEKISEKARGIIFDNQVVLPCKVDWCGCCDGSGTRSRYDVEGYDINAMLYDEDGIIDEQFAEDYFNGRTDIKCDECEGTRIQTMMDFESCNELQKEIVQEQRRIENEEYQDKIDSEKLYRAEMGYC